MPLILLLCLGLICAPDDSKKTEEPQPGIEDTYRSWVRELLTNNKLQQEKTIKSMLPDQRDIEYLFPRYASRLWPIIENSRKQTVSNADKLVQAFAKAGRVTNIKVVNIRENEKKQEVFAEVLKILPKEVPICDLVVGFEKSSTVSGTYLFVHGRWIWFQALETLPPVLKQLD
ncbi:MAG TPA: hypothetical protein PKA06_09785 [Gemmatales bacterium]|nr:hypothetical protein [Gemmatales bacterium]HMP15461.1 hypothetical protein [Gemmatales bacterium]